MKKRISTYLKNVLGTLCILLITGIIVLLCMNGSVNYRSNDMAKVMEGEGPYVFFENDSILSTNYIKGNKDTGFYVQKKVFKVSEEPLVSSTFLLDSTNFSFRLTPTFITPKSYYSDEHPILAISDIESGYKTFRDFLIKNQVINSQLEWTFGKGHLVLLGDFVDRGASATQVLWFIYKLEQEATKKGGTVHFILGNHELKNLQGDYQSSSQKYRAVSAILEKQQIELFSQKSFLGRWLSSKNVIEMINGHLFVHGGIHPDIVSYTTNLDAINNTVRSNYYHTFYPKTAKSLSQFLCSTRTGIAWYRGYFKNMVTQPELDATLRAFNAKAVVVGHTIQFNVKKLFSGKVFAIDVKHPKDYEKNWPSKSSEGLLIKNNNYFRVLHNGTLKNL